jgi:hypothetical protein
MLNVPWVIVMASNDVADAHSNPPSKKIISRIWIPPPIISGVTEIYG